MTNTFSRLVEGTPDPWPVSTNTDGALPGDLPLTMPRRQEKSAKVTITDRDVATKVTLYEILQPGAEKAVQCKIDTSNEWILRTGVGLANLVSGPRVKVSNMFLARVVASQTPTRHHDRIYVDHADHDTCNDTAANLHWVTPAFNAFNRKRPQKDIGYFGVRQNGNWWEVKARLRDQGRYRDEETAARVYDLVCTLAYGDQLVKANGRLNQLEQDKLVFLVVSQSDGVMIYKVDDIFVVTYDTNVEGSAGTLGEAKRLAKTLKETLRVREERKEETWREKVKSISVQRNDQGIAFFKVRARATATQPAKDVEILVDDKDYLELRAQEVRIATTWTNRVCVYRNNDGYDLLSRWLCKPSTIEIVDHLSGDIFDHRRSNLAVRDRSANSQNFRRQAGFMGVSWSWKGSRWYVQVAVKGAHRTVSQRFDTIEDAVERYDLTVLYQYGPNALVNHPEKLAEYLDRLSDESQQSRLQDFLKGDGKRFSSRFQGVGYAKPRFWRSNCFFHGRRAPEQRSYDQSEPGSELRAAISYDLWRLKLNSSDLVVNFEHLRPCYQYWLPHLTKENQGTFIDTAYELLGGTSFVFEEDLPFPLTSPSTSRGDSMQDAVVVSDSSSRLPVPVSPPVGPSPSAVALGKRKART